MDSEYRSCLPRQEPIIRFDGTVVRVLAAREEIDHDFLVRRPGIRQDGHSTTHLGAQTRIS